jgi:Tol biopolymer transport system component
MSPEQAEAKLTDKRSDVWSFGVVLYEMLSGKRCFDGKSTAHVMVHLLEDEPDWEKLPAGMPSGLRNLLERCLQKDPAKRLRDVGDLRLQLEALAEEASTASRTARAAPTRGQARGLLRWAWQGIAAVAVVAALALAFLYLRSRPPAPAEVTRFEIGPPAGTTLNQLSAFTVSPDGRKLVFQPAAVRGGGRQLWVRSLDALESYPLPGTEGVEGVPIWSPDSRFIVFTSAGGLKKIESSGGPVETLCGVPGDLQGGFWTPDDRIVFAVNASSGLLQVRASVEMPTPVTTLAAGEIRHGFPALLPDGRHFVYAAFSSANTGFTYLGSLDAKPDQQQIKKVLSDRSRPAYVASANPGSKSGYLLFVRGSTLVAQAFNMGRLELAGEVQPIAENIVFDAFSASNGVLVYLPGVGGALQQFTWFDQQGQPHGAAGEPFIGGFTSEPALSPDEKRLAFARPDPQSGNVDIWINELPRDLPTRFTTDPGQDVEPLWSPDGSSIVFTGQRNGVRGLYRKASNLMGGEELLYKSDHGQPDYATSWSQDRRYILFQKGGNGVFALRMDDLASDERKPIEVVPPGSNARGARFLPDPHYVSYVSEETGQDEIYVQTFDPNPASGPKTAPGKWQVSKGGGTSMRWRADGKRLFYLNLTSARRFGGTTASNRDMMAVDVTYSPKFHPEVPKRLFPSHSASIYWEMTGNGQRFLIPIALGQSASAPYTVVLNWTALLKK